ncbi:hypothetical protein KXQ82_00380 [Mucilaginibacter sp. HMF5004]|uniref:hypothetical protein n=1 Tax=Mucilaginibacter rivuli TaxID=2857527 RepID=UPI001C5D7B74|nr:hypothetical protein [Mucilaginibacter rivuli]MBW4888142.1 hypothetical protein [Mucilaginibacter rivuli]
MACKFENLLLIFIKKGNAMLSKNKIHELIDHMPEDFSADELIEKIILLQKVEIGRQQIKDGESLTEEEMDKLIDSWQ